MNSCLLCSGWVAYEVHRGSLRALIRCKRDPTPHEVRYGESCFRPMPEFEASAIEAAGKILMQE